LVQASKYSFTPKVQNHKPHSTHWRFLFTRLEQTHLWDSYVSSSALLPSEAYHYSNILINIQQDATLHSLFYLETAPHVSGGTTTHHQERKLYLQHLVFVTPLLLPAASRFHVPDKINCVTLHLIGHILEYSYDAWTRER
jgi:hypothetical protein